MKAAACSTLALAIAFALGDARADSPINEHRDASPTAQIEVSNVKGTVTVSGWDKPEVAITGTLGDGAKKLSVEGSADHLRIKVEPPDKQGWFSWGADTRMGDSVLDIRVPKNAEMKIEVVSADVSLSGVAGRSLRVDGVSGKLRLDSGAKEVELDSVSGDIDVTGSADRAHVETVSGNIRARGLGGQVKFETVSGDVNLRGKPDTGARVDVETMSGDVHLYLPSDVSARLNASSFSGRIRSDFGTVTEPEHGPGSSLEVNAGSGGGQVKLQTFSGDIDIRKQ